MCVCVHACACACVCVHPCMCVCVLSFSLMTAVLHRPILSYTVISDDGRDIKVTITWATPDSTTRGMEYVLSMRNSSKSSIWTMNATHLDLTLHHGIHYAFTVSSQRCEGSVKSRTSQLLRVFFPGIGNK